MFLTSDKELEMSMKAFSIKNLKYWNCSVTKKFVKRRFTNNLVVLTYELWLSQPVSVIFTYNLKFSWYCTVLICDLFLGGAVTSCKINVIEESIIWFKADIAPTESWYLVHLNFLQPRIPGLLLFCLWVLPTIWKVRIRRKTWINAPMSSDVL